MLFKQKHKNHLLLIRKKTGLEQKQVAALLGHKTADQISRFERGAKLPNLKTALKLGIIYQLPIRVLFYEYFEACFDELKNQGKDANTVVNSNNLKEVISSDGVEFCTFAEKLKAVRVPKTDLDEVRSHIAKLVRGRGERSGHFTPKNDLV